MLDSLSIKLIRKPLALSAKYLDKCGITANQTTVFGFVLGCFALPALITEQYLLALLFILLNRICDGLDGALARIQGITDAGGFLDISLDFLFYSLIPFGFVLANPEHNAVAGAFLIFSFIGTGSSFLAFAIMAGKQGIDNPVYKKQIALLHERLNRRYRNHWLLGFILFATATLCRHRVYLWRGMLVYYFYTYLFRVSYA